MKYRGPIIRSARFGYVVENFIGPNVYTGEQSDYITRNGKIVIFPDLESIPPNWVKYAYPATQLQAAIGTPWPKIVRRITEEHI